jgi:hypothetical protein
VTAEKVAQMLCRQHQGLILFDDEVAGWMFRMDAYNSSKGKDRKFWLKTTGGAPDQVDRKSDKNEDDEGIEVPYNTVAVCGPTQTFYVDKLLSGDKDTEGDGFSARLLLALPDKVPHEELVKHGLSGKEHHMFLDNLAVKLGASLRMTELEPGRFLPVEIEFSDEALVLFNKRRSEQKAREDSEPRGAYKEYLGKWDMQAGKLCLIYALADWAVDPGAGEVTEISLSATVRALKYADYLEQMYVKALHEASAFQQVERDASAIADYIVENGLEVVNERKLSHVPA